MHSGAVFQRLRLRIAGLISPAAAPWRQGAERGESPIKPMTKNQFAMLCAELLIDPAIALENEIIREALLARKSEEQIRSILQSQF